jgi:hypothetical protein
MRIRFIVDISFPRAWRDVGVRASECLLIAVRKVRSRSAETRRA